MRAHFISAVIGGLLVGGAFVVFGVAGHGTTTTVLDSGSVAAAEPTSSTTAGQTPHDIYVRDAPGVVYVRAQVIQQVADPFNLYPQQQESISTGSGFLLPRGAPLDHSGLILTNYHVVDGADPKNGISVQFEDNVSRRAVVIRADQNDDLAVLKVDLGGLSVRPLLLGDSTTVRVGDPTLAIGNPFGYDRTLTSGIVSALQRQIQAPNGFTINNVIQTDAPINPGNSGGPLLDANGRVIGINSQIATASGGSIGIAFAVPINTAQQKVLDGLGASGPVRVAYLGANGDFSPVRHGVVVRKPEPGGPAASAGLRGGDEIQSIDGRAVSTPAQLQQDIAARAPGQTVELRVLRAGRLRTVRVRLGSQALR
jgi:S1-C subfamily serine protease